MKNISVLFLLSFIFLSGCSDFSSKIKPEEKRVESIHCIAVTPVIAYVEDGLPEMQTEKLKQGAVYTTEVIKALIKDNPRIRLIDASDGAAVAQGVSRGRLGVVNEIGERVGCQAVLLTTLQRFEQRKGSDMAVEEPASAAFEMTLHHVPSGNVLWAREFQETQEPFLTNIFSSKMGRWGFRWVTVEELVRQGVEERLAECPYL